MAVIELDVAYTGEGLNPDIDKAIEYALKPFGYVFQASGFDLNEKRRDLIFEKEEI